MIQTTDYKTRSFIQSIKVNGGRPKNLAAAFPVIVRPPQNMKCFRATITVNDIDSNDAGEVWISTSPVSDGNENTCLVLSSWSKTDDAVSPFFNYNTIQTFVFDRRSVGYMADEFYFYADAANVIIVWEGILIQE